MLTPPGAPCRVVEQVLERLAAGRAGQRVGGRHLEQAALVFAQCGPGEQQHNRGDRQGDQEVDNECVKQRRFTPGARLLHHQEPVQLRHQPAVEVDRVAVGAAKAQLGGGVVEHLARDGLAAGAFLQMDETGRVRATQSNLPLSVDQVNATIVTLLVIFQQPAHGIQRKTDADGAEKVAFAALYGVVHEDAEPAAIGGVGVDIQVVRIARDL